MTKKKSNTGIKSKLSELKTKLVGKTPDMIDHPPHYADGDATCECGRTIECIDVTRHQNFNLGNAMKYIWRCDAKDDPITNLQKAIWYLNDEIKRRA